MTAEELIQCDICKGYVPFTHDHCNGMKVDEVGHVCSGCMTAAGLHYGMQNAEATTLAKTYVAKRQKELANIKITYSICDSNGNPLSKN